MNYEELAAAVKESMEAGVPMKYAKIMAGRLAQVCAARDSRFDSALFYAACGVL